MVLLLRLMTVHPIRVRVAPGPVALLLPRLRLAAALVRLAR
jgi:hypothetical protein